MCYQVIAGGDYGTVYLGESFFDAMRVFTRYAQDSIAKLGKMAGESVSLFTNEHLTREYVGVNDK